MDLGLDGRVALVTAASRGLGRACALALGGERARVALGARSADLLAEAAGAIERAGGEALPLALDLADEGSIRSAVDAVVARWGRVDVLVVNGPGPPSGAVADITVEQWREALDMAVLAPVRLIQAVLGPMRAQGGGRIIFITTVGVRVAQPNMVLSNATRLAAVGLAKTLSVEAAGDGVLVNVLAPGPIATDRMTELVDQTAQRGGVSREEAERVWLDEVPLGRMGRPEDVANLVALLASEACTYVTGTVIPVDGGKSRAY